MMMLDRRIVFSPSRNAGPGCVRRRAMSQLPARPDLDQLRRQARELHRAALGGDADALRRLRQVSGNVGLSAAQLAIAREYGFASWPRLKAEVERRRAQVVTGVGENEDLDREDRTDAEAEELIASQYADRPQLRPVLDAVLAALPAAGPATVQARKTFVSLVTPPHFRRRPGGHQESGRPRPALGSGEPWRPPAP